MRIGTSKMARQDAISSSLAFNQQRQAAGKRLASGWQVAGKWLASGWQVAQLRGVSMTSRTFFARLSGVKGFWMKAWVASATPCSSTVSLV